MTRPRYLTVNHTHLCWHLPSLNIHPTQEQPKPQDMRFQDFVYVWSLNLISEQSRIPTVLSDFRFYRLLHKCFKNLILKSTTFRLVWRVWKKKKKNRSRQSLFYNFALTSLFIVTRVLMYLYWFVPRIMFSFPCYKVLHSFMSKTSKQNKNFLFQWFSNYGSWY